MTKIEPILFMFIGAVIGFILGAMITAVKTPRPHDNRAFDFLRLKQEGILECQGFAAIKTNEDWGYKSCVDEVNKVYEEGKSVKFL